jgi:membrane associated rhomboid family serine protease
MIPLYDLNPHRRIPWITVVIIIANIAVMVWMTGAGEREQQIIAANYGFLPKRLSHVDSGRPINAPIRGVDVRGREPKVVVVGVVPVSTDSSDVYATLLTTMFLHGGWMHLISNMWILWIFGNNVEDRLGHLMYIGYYLVGGIAATFCHYAIDTQSDIPVIGASGAVAATLGGYAVTFPWAKVRTLIFVGLIMVIDIPALVWLGIWFVFQNLLPGIATLQGAVQAPVAYWAHIGGFVAGIVLMPVLSLGASPPGADWRKEADDMFQYNDPRSRFD